MKISDIKVGEEYAAGKGRYGYRPDRVRVVDVGVNLHGRSDGVEIILLDKETGKKVEGMKGRWTRCTSYRHDGKLFTRGQSIVCTWAEEDARWQAKRAKAEAEEEARNALEEKRGRLRVKLQSLTGGQDGQIASSSWEQDMVEIELEFLFVLAERLENAERELRKRRMFR